MSARARQTAIGLGFAAALIAAWLAIHVAGIFFWRWTPASVPVAVLLVLVQAWLSTGLFIVAHDAMHGSLAPGRPRVNAGVGTLCLGLYAALSYRRLRPKHGEHHVHSGTADDPDFHPGAPTRLVPWFVRFFTGYYTHAQILRITMVAAAYVLVLGAPLANIVVFWAVPALLALVQLFVFGTYLPHRHGEAAFADHHRARSSTLSAPMAILTCFNFGGFHHEHHLSPSTPWWRLPSVRAPAPHA